jgi:signal transduction histidine kinase
MADLEGKEVNDFLVDTEGPEHTAWASVWGQGPARWDGAHWHFPAPAEGFPGRFPVALAQSRSATGESLLWVGTYEQGLAYRRRNRWQVLTTDNGLRSNGVYALLPDPWGKPTIWLGMQGGGITALSMEGWVAFMDRRSGLPSAGVTCFLEPRSQGQVRLFGTRRGVAWRTPEGWRTQDERQGLPAAEVRALAEWNDGTRDWVFAGTARGLARWTGSRWQREPGLPAEDVQVLLATPGPGPLYAGLRSGLWVQRGKGWSRLEPVPGQPGPEPLSLAVTDESSGGSLWVGTRGEGLWRFSGDGWQRIDPIPAYPSQWLTALKATRTPDGRPCLWLGTRGNGLLRAEIEAGLPRWQVYTAKDPVPLPHTVVLRIEQDRRNRLYLGTSGGVERLTFGADGRTLQRTETFTTGDGLPATASSPGASLVDREGRVWFGFPDGSAFLDPDEEPLHRQLPAPVLQRAIIAGRETGPDASGLYLPYQENHLSIDFFLPVFHREEDLRFRTQLLGAEPSPGPWRYEATREYAGIAPGAYVLKVWARDHQGQVSPPLVVQVRVAAPPWATPVAWTAYLVGAAAALWTLLQLRTRRLRRQARVLSARVEEATSALRSREHDLENLALQLRELNEQKSHLLGIVAHDLRNPLNAILLQAELMIEEQPEAEAKPVQRIAASARNLLGMLERLLDVSRIETGTVAADCQPMDLRILAAEARERHAATAARKGLDLLLLDGSGLPAALADPSVLGEVLDNLLSNAVKFSHPGSAVRLEFETRDREVAVAVQDQGPGFTEADRARAFERFSTLSAQPTGGEDTTGLGLFIVKKLTEAMGGRVELRSNPGQGSRFLVWLPRFDFAEGNAEGRE